MMDKILYFVKFKQDLGVNVYTLGFQILLKSVIYIRFFRLSVCLLTCNQNTKTFYFCDSLQINKTALYLSKINFSYLRRWKSVMYLPLYISIFLQLTNYYSTEPSTKTIFVKMILYTIR